MPGLLWEDKVRNRLAEFPRFIYDASIPITGWQVADAAWDQRSIPPSVQIAEAQGWATGGEVPTNSGGFRKCTIPRVGGKGRRIFVLRHEGEWELPIEALLYVNGKPLQGLDTRHQEAVLPPNMFKGAESWTLPLKPLPV